MRTVAATLMTMAILAGGPADPRPPASPEVVSEVIGRHTGGVIGSVHDFAGPDTQAGEACKTCHLPHMQAIRPTTRPAATQPATQPAFEMYRISGQRRVFIPNRYTPGPTSLICLGCHDGTIATSTIGSSHAMLAGVREGFHMPDGFVWRDHPIGVPYPSHPREYHPQSFVQARGIRLPDGRIECISCHDPHNELQRAGMLVMSNRRSNLCLTCHIK